MYPGFFRPAQLQPEDEVPILVNCTPHPIRFRDHDGRTVEVQPSGYTLKAAPQEKSVGAKYGAELVCTRFVPSPEGDQELAEIAARDGCLIPIGSIISAQAWPGRVFALVPVEGFERKPPAEKLYRCDKFTVFAGNEIVLTRKQARHLYSLAWRGSVGQGDIDWLNEVLPGV